jgi:hypothetical protein
VATTDIYHGDHTIEAKSGILTIKGDTVLFSGALAFSDATLEDLTVTGILTASTINSFDSAFRLRTASVGALFTSTSADLSLETLGGGDINITTSALGDIDINSNYDIHVDAVRYIGITGANVTINGDGGAASVRCSDAGIVLSNFTQTDSFLLMQPSTEVLIRGTNDGVGNYSQVLVVQNQWDDSQCDGMAIVLEPSILSPTNVFLRFSKDGDIEDFGGRIRGPTSSSSVAFTADGSNGGGTVDGTGDVVYASGSSDFGEWIEVGDLNEWNLTKEQEDFIENNAPHMGLPEGWVCYVRDNKYYKEGPGTPMVVTRRPLLVGNEHNKEGYVGEIFSFSGQISAIVKGVVKSGDLLIPSGSYYCTAISPELVTFNEYKKVIGTAWTNSSLSEDEFGRVMMAVGVKNTF